MGPRVCGSWSRVHMHELYGVRLRVERVAFRSIKSRVCGGGLWIWEYRGTSLIRSSALLGPYSRTMPRAQW